MLSIANKYVLKQVIWQLPNIASQLQSEKTYLVIICNNITQLASGNIWAKMVSKREIIFKNVLINAILVVSL